MLFLLLSFFFHNCELKAKDRSCKALFGLLLRSFFFGGCATAPFIISQPESKSCSPKAHEIPPTSLYELRHTFVSIAKVLPAGEVKSWVGHSSNMDTFGIYAHALRDDVTRVADDFAGLYQRLLQPFEEVGTKVGTE